MSRFRAYQDASARKPARVVKLAPGAWAETWDERPTEPVEVGVRITSDADGPGAREHALRVARAAHPNLDERSKIWADTFNQALMHWTIAQAICQPDDVDTPYFELQEFVIAPGPNQGTSRLSTAGAARLWDEITLLAIGRSPLVLALDAEDLPRLAAAITDDAWWAGMTPDIQRQVARHLAYLTEIAPLPPAPATS